MANSTSTTISFTTQTLDSTSGATISIELDADKNNDKSSFNSGDTVFFKVFTSPQDMAIEADSSAGTVTLSGLTTGEITETIVFANEKEATLSKIADSIVSFSWQGRDLGSPSLNGNILTLPAAGVGVLQLTYKASGKAGNLSAVTIPTGVKEFQVAVVISEKAV